MVLSRVTVSSKFQAFTGQFGMGSNTSPTSCLLWDIQVFQERKCTMDCCCGQRPEAVAPKIPRAPSAVSAVRGTPLSRLAVVAVSWDNSAVFSRWARSFMKQHKGCIPSQRRWRKPWKPWRPWNDGPCWSCPAVDSRKFRCLPKAVRLALIW